MTDPTALARSLAANAFLAGLGSEAIGALATLGVSRRLAADETLFRKGDAGDALYAVRRGQIRIATGTEAGGSFTLNIHGPGDVFGEVALLDGRPRTADAVAAEVTELFMLRRRDFLALLERRPDLAIRFTELLCERVRWMTTRMEETALMPLQTRLARRLLALAEDYGAELTVSQEELGVFVGASRESVNRLLQAWRRQDLIALGRGRVRLLAADRLARHAELEDAA
ncbi:MAG TPA: Crp/Fnr family transcriptional regulator [Beijerinckiaceae bacterium]|jgi:CRP-like cAMP-binding protein